MTISYEKLARSWSDDKMSSKEVEVKTSICSYRLFVDNNYAGYCYFMFNEKDARSVEVLGLHIEPGFRCQGYGTLLLHEVLFDCYTVHGTSRVNLCDSSERCGKNKNIYVKNGTRVQIQ